MGFTVIQPLDKPDELSTGTSAAVVLLRDVTLHR